MKMKKNVFIAAALLFTAALFFTACPDGKQDDNNNGITYTLTISGGGIIDGAVNRNQDDTLVITKTLTASDDSSTAGITFNIACTTAGHTNCGITANQAVTMIMIDVDAAAGAHAIKINAVKDGETVAAANLTLNITLTPYGLDLQVPIDVKHYAEDKYIYYFAKAPNGDLSGITYEISSCKTHQNCGLSFTNTANQFNINYVPDSVVVGNHELTASMKKGGNEVYSANLNLAVALKYTLTITIPEASKDKDGNLMVRRGDIVDLSNVFSVTISDGTIPVFGDENQGNPNKLDINAYCLADYGNCDLFSERKNDDGTINTLQLIFPVPMNVPLNHAHGIVMQVYKVLWGPDPNDWQDGFWGDALDSSSLNIIVVE